MRNNKHSFPVWRGSLNTLAQNGTNNLAKPAQIITGQGSELNNPKGRAKRKMISQVMSVTLLDIANKNENFDRIKSYWNTYHCQERLYSFEGRYYGKYCKNRFCTLCCSIRKAEIINRYLPTLKEWETPYFVTLTVKSITKKLLPVVMKKMRDGFKQINGKYRKRNLRGKGIKLLGIKSLECNFNPIRKEYNPHFHLIVANKEIADILVKEWLILWKDKEINGRKIKWSTKGAQCIKKIKSLENSLIEIIKYGTKIFTEPDLENKSKIKDNTTIQAGALYTIFEAMRGLRIFERFGFDLPKIDKKTPNTRIVSEYHEWVFVPQFHDWLNTDNELVLTAYSPNKELKNLLVNGINNDLE